MDDRLSPAEREALSALAQTLGLERPGEGGLAAFLAEARKRAWALAEEERRARQANGTYRAASLALVRSFDSRGVLEQLLDYLNWIVPYDMAVVFLADGSGRLVPRARREWREDASAGDEAAALFLARDAGLEGEPLTASSGGERRLGLPMPGPGGSPGAVVLARRSERDFGEEEVRAAEAFAGQASAALRNATLFEELKETDAELVESYDDTIEALSKALDLRDHDTEGHTLRVAAATRMLAEAMGIPAEARVQMRRGALLHDIGKIGIPDSILCKPGPLDPGEREIMKRHTVYAQDLLSGIPFLRPALEIAYCHHERWDGSGYPRGLERRSIPLAARVFAVVDVWDALTSDRPYRRALSESDARSHIAKESGAHFDPEIVDVFLKIFGE